MKRVKPSLGDALVIKYYAEDRPFMSLAIAECECGDPRAIYTAVSGSAAGARKLIYRKHRKHLATCVRQAELFRLDQTCTCTHGSDVHSFYGETRSECHVCECSAWRPLAETIP